MVERIRTSRFPKRDDHVSGLLGAEAFTLYVGLGAAQSGGQPGPRRSAGPPRLHAGKPVPLWLASGRRGQRQIDGAGRIRRAGGAEWSARRLGQRGGKRRVGLALAAGHWAANRNRRRREMA